jgi:hypothetical protein
MSASNFTPGPLCPRCGCTDTTHPRNYGKSQTDRWWCMACGALWTPEHPRLDYEHDGEYRIDHVSEDEPPPPTDEDARAALAKAEGSR